MHRLVSSGCGTRVPHSQSKFSIKILGLVSLAGFNIDLSEEATVEDRWMSSAIFICDSGYAYSYSDLGEDAAHSFCFAIWDHYLFPGPVARRLVRTTEEPAPCGCDDHFSADCSCGRTSSVFSFPYRPIGGGGYSILQEFACFLSHRCNDQAER